MFELEQDYLKFLRNPQWYMERELELVDIGYNEGEKKEYPIVKCGDILLYFNHYESFEKAEECWNRRKQRIDWKNLLIEMYTADEDLAREFQRLPYEKKICFVPFETHELNFCYVNFYDEMGQKEELWKSVNKLAQRKLLYYDDIELLYDGKIRRLCEYK